MTTWNGKVTFGMINFDVAMERTVKDQSISFKQFDKESKSPIHRVSIRESDGKVVTAEQIVKGLDTGGDTVIFTNDEVSAIKGNLEHAIEVLDFVPWHQVPTWIISNRYYLLPRGSGKNVYPSYRLFVNSCLANNAAAIVRFVLRTKQYTGVVYVDGPENREYLMLGTLPYVDEVTEVKEKLEGYWSAIGELEFDPKMIEMANTLVATMMVDTFDHQKYQDEFKVKLITEAERKKKLRGKKRSDNVVSLATRRRAKAKEAKGKTG